MDPRLGLQRMSGKAFGPFLSGSCTEVTLCILSSSSNMEEALGSSGFQYTSDAKRGVGTLGSHCPAL